MAISRLFRSCSQLQRQQVTHVIALTDAHDLKPGFEYEISCLMSTETIKVVGSNFIYTDDNFAVSKTR